MFWYYSYENKQIITGKVVRLFSSQLQKMERQSGNTGRLNSNLYITLKFTERPKTTGMTSKKNAFPEGNKPFAGDFGATLDEANADMVQFTRIWTWNLIV